MMIQMSSGGFTYLGLCDLDRGSISAVFLVVLISIF
jgi:hypothetical protein